MHQSHQARHLGAQFVLERSMDAPWLQQWVRDGMFPSYEKSMTVMSDHQLLPSVWAAVINS